MQEKGEQTALDLCLEDELAVGKVHLALVLALSDAGALVLWKDGTRSQVSVGRLRLGSGCECEQRWQ